MSQSADFIVILDDGVRKRHIHETTKGKVIHFVVQLEVFVENEWKVVIRYDCAHGYAHVDLYDIVGNRRKKELNLTFSSALTFGDWDIKENWHSYKESFLRGSEYEGI
jgi:hypothetical protein